MIPKLTECNQDGWGDGVAVWGGRVRGRRRLSFPFHQMKDTPPETKRDFVKSNALFNDFPPIGSYTAARAQRPMISNNRKR